MLGVDEARRRDDGGAQEGCDHARRGPMYVSRCGDVKMMFDNLSVKQHEVGPCISVNNHIYTDTTYRDIRRKELQTYRKRLGEGKGEGCCSGSAVWESWNYAKSCGEGKGKGECKRGCG